MLAERIGRPADPDSILQRVRMLAATMPDGEAAVIPHPAVYCTYATPGRRAGCYLNYAVRKVAARYGLPRLRVRHEGRRVILWR